MYEFKDGESLAFTNDESYLFKCVASGSNPQPVMEFTIGYQNHFEILNEKFLRTDQLISDPASGDVAFRRTNYAGIMTAMEVMTIDWKANSQEIRCTASVATMDVPLSKHIKPVMKCKLSSWECCCVMRMRNNIWRLVFMVLCSMIVLTSKKNNICL